MEFSARERVTPGWDMMQCTKRARRMAAFKQENAGSRWQLKGWLFHLDTRMTFSATTVVHTVQGVPQHGEFGQSLAVVKGLLHLVVGNDNIYCCYL